MSAWAGLFPFANEAEALGGTGCGHYFFLGYDRIQPRIQEVRVTRENKSSVRIDVQPVLGAFSLPPRHIKLPPLFKAVYLTFFPAPPRRRVALHFTTAYPHDGCGGTRSVASVFSGSFEITSVNNIFRADY